MSRAQLLTAVPTPFGPDERLDTNGVATLFAAVREASPDGVFVAGTTGEFTALDDDERLVLARIALRVFGPERVFVHVGAAASRQAERLAVRSVEAGATRLAAVTPFYFPGPGDAVLRYFERVVAAAGNAEVWAYLFAARTTTRVPPEALADLQRVGVLGAKISGEDDDAVRAYVAAAPSGFRIISGNDASFPQLRQVGGLGVVSGVSSVFPRPFRDMRDALNAGDEDGVADAQARIDRAVRVVRSGSIAHLKAGLRLRGLPAGPVRISTDAVGDSDLAELRAAVTDLA